MQLRDHDRRGLGEIVSLSVVTLTVGLVIGAQMFTGQPLDHVLMDILVAAATVTIARGTQGAAERSGSSETFNAATAAIHQAIHQALASYVPPGASPPLPPGAQLVETKTTAIVPAGQRDRTGEFTSKP